MSVELHLPDLPEVPIALGQRGVGAPPPGLPWHVRLRDALSAYLPLLLMALLALASWWLVKNSPHPEAQPEARPVSRDPDYTMTQFALERFDAVGRLKLRLEGAQLRHYPADDRIEVESAAIRAVAPDGRVTLARSQRAVGNADGSELQLMGGAEITTSDGAGQPIVMRGEYFRIDTVAERISSHLPVSLHGSAGDVRAAALDYDHPARRLELKGPLRGVLPPRGTR